MADVTVIGRGTRVRGHVSGQGDFEIHGYLEGAATIEGELTVEGTALVAANLTGRRIVVRGAVRGDISASELLSLEDGARVVGDLSAPRVAIASGALVRGEVQAGDVAPREGVRSSVQSAGGSAAKGAPKGAPSRAVASTLPVIGSAMGARPGLPAKPAVVAAEDDGDGEAVDEMDLHRAGGAPPPVVPALKKGAKGAIHKKRA